MLSNRRIEPTNRLFPVFARASPAAYAKGRAGSSSDAVREKTEHQLIDECATASLSGLRCWSESEIVWNLSAASLVSPARVRPERSFSGS